MGGGKILKGSSVACDVFDLYGLAVGTEEVTEHNNKGEDKREREILAEQFRSG